MKRENGIGMESYSRSYSNSQLHISFDFEPYGFLSYHARHPSEARDYQEETVELGERKAILISYCLDEKKGKSYFAGLFVGDWANGRVNLVIWVTGKNRDTIETAKRMFNTVGIP